MRFVSTETVRIYLKDTVTPVLEHGQPKTDDDGKPLEVRTRNWIDVKKELGKGEDTAFRAAGLGAMNRASNGSTGIDVDYEKMAFARVMTYLVDWSAENAKGKRIDISKESDKHKALRELVPEDFDEIDQAIQDHIAAVTEEKKVPTGSSALTLVSA